MKSEKIGYIDVDAGLCWVGDPCYILHKEEPPEEIGRSWDEFCNKLDDDFDQKGFKNFGHSLGFAIQTGYGDGRYPVYIKKNGEGRIIEIKIKFT